MKKTWIASGNGLRRRKKELTRLVKLEKKVSTAKYISPQFVHKLAVVFCMYKNKCNYIFIS